MSTHGTTVVVSRPADLLEHRDAVMALYNRVGPPWSPVAHPEWLQAWWTQPGRQPKVRCYLGYQGGRLSVCIPLEFTQEQYSGLTARKVTSTNLRWGWTSALIDPASGWHWVAPFTTWLAETAPTWSAVELGAFPVSQSATQELYAAFSEREWFVELFPRDMAVLHTNGAYDDFLAQRRNLRRATGRALRRAQESGFEVKAAWNPSSSLLSRTVVAVSRRSWQGQQGSAVSVRFPGFYDRLLEVQSNLRVLLTWVQDADGIPVAYELCVGTDHALHSVDTGYDPGASAISPGSLAAMETIRQASLTGIPMVDLGDYAEYKQFYHPEPYAGEQVLASRGTISAWARLARSLRRRREVSRRRP